MNKPIALVTGSTKGIGKSTFIYHIINYLLSLKEKDSYSIETQRIDKKNYSLGGAAEEIIVPTSPYEKLRDTILAQGDFAKRQTDIAKFIKNIM